MNKGLSLDTKSMLSGSSRQTELILQYCGDMMLMPGLPKYPAAINMDVDKHGNITGLF